MFYFEREILRAEQNRLYEGDISTNAMLFGQYLDFLKLLITKASLRDAFLKSPISKTYREVY
jgi:hypothetical protein